MSCHVIKVYPDKKKIGIREIREIGNICLVMSCHVLSCLVMSYKSSLTQHIWTRLYCTCLVNILFLLLNCCMMYILGIYVLSCRFIKVYPDKKYWDKSTCHVKMSFSLLKSCCVLHDKTNCDKEIQHLSCQYVIFITRRLYDKNIGNICLVMSCHVMIVYPDTTYRYKVKLHLSCQYVVLTGKWMYDRDTGIIYLVMSYNSFLARCIKTRENCTCRGNMSFLLLEGCII